MTEYDMMRDVIKRIRERERECNYRDKLSELIILELATLIDTIRDSKRGDN